MNKPIIFVDVDGVLTANKKLYYEVEKPLPQPSITINPIYPPVPPEPFIRPKMPNIPWSPIPGPTYPPNPLNWLQTPTYPDPLQGTFIFYNNKQDLCCQDDGYNDISPVQAQEDWDFDIARNPQVKFTNIDSTNFLQVVSQTELYVAKQFSDKDSYIIQRAKALKSCDIILISGDERVNKAWAEKQGVEFIYCPPEREKWDILSRRTLEHFYYIGDAMPDFLCLTYAKKAFIPADASPLLINKLLRNCRLCRREDPIRVPRNGGDGVLDWAYTYLFTHNLLLNEI